MRLRSPRFSVPHSALFCTLVALSGAARSERSERLEEVIVTAQKRAQSLQDAPLAVSALGRTQLEAHGIGGLDALAGGLVPPLKIMPFANSPSTLVMTVRGNGPTDMGPVTREGSTAIYLDEIYLGRAQGLSMELADLERIEVLRGPQGTLFGRNATGGAVNLISRRPSGQFEFEQILGRGNYDAWRSVTRLHLPAFAGLRVKFDYLHSERDGWVDNRAPGEADYNEYRKDGGRFSIDYQPLENLMLAYSYDNSRVEATQNYYQLYVDNIGMIGAERDRRKHTRFALALDPTVTQQQGHALIATWNATDHLTVKSLTGYRELAERTRNNFGGVLYYNGYIAAVDVDQSQRSQELQLIGTANRLDWIAGAYFYREDAHEEFQNLFSLDQFGLYTGVPLTPINPPTPFNAFTGANDPLRIVSADAESRAIYGQLTWTAPILAERLRLTLGGRYTDDDKRGVRHLPGSTTIFDLDTQHFDSAITAEYRWTDTVSTYLKRATGYQAGGVNPRSSSFRAFDENEVVSWEFGIKSEFWQRRARLNAAIFRGDYDGIPIEYANPADISLTETINAERKVRVDGAELDLSLIPAEHWLIGMSYTYLDGDMPLQPNPLAGGALQRFILTQTPRHAGSLAVDYSFAPWRVGTLTAHMDITSTTGYAYVQTDLYRRDAYTLLNARLTMADISLGAGRSKLKVSVWGKNLTDEEYVVMSFPVGDPVATVVQAFGDPRGYGVDVVYKY